MHGDFFSKASLSRHVVGIGAKIWCCSKLRTESDDFFSASPDSAYNPSMGEKGGQMRQGLSDPLTVPFKGKD
jgi:hypothetical protein